MEFVSSLFNCCGPRHKAGPQNPPSSAEMQAKLVDPSNVKEALGSQIAGFLPRTFNATTVLNESATVIQALLASLCCFNFADTGATEAPPAVAAKEISKESQTPILLSFKMIWNGAPYCAFTDLIEFQGQYFCCFRESNSHQDGENGTIRILVSTDAENWTSVASLASTGYDLRDPKFSIDPKGQLMLNMGATVWGANGSETLNSAVTFSADGKTWENVQVLPYTNEWIWHVTWHKGKDAPNDVAYGCAYSIIETNPQMKLMQSTDGINYTTTKTFKISKGPTETTLRFLPDDTMVALVRRNTGGGLIGTSPPPYTDWKWHNTKQNLGGPDFLILPDGEMWASSRAGEVSNGTTVLATMGINHYKPVLTLPVGGDCSYPGMVFKKLADNRRLLVESLYATDQSNNACIYIAIIQLPSR